MWVFRKSGNMLLQLVLCGNLSLIAVLHYPLFMIYGYYWNYSISGLVLCGCMLMRCNAYGMCHTFLSTRCECAVHCVHDVQDTVSAQELPSASMTSTFSRLTAADRSREFAIVFHLHT